MVETDFDKKCVGEWASDESSDHCKKCRQRFRFLFRRRHHCRRCGGLFCASCSSGTTVLKELGNTQVRVCQSCEERVAGSAFKQLKLAGEDNVAALHRSSPPPALESLRRSSSLYQQTISAPSTSFNSSVPSLSITSSTSPHQRSLPTFMVWDAVQARSRVMTSVDSRPNTPVAATGTQA